MKLVLPRDPDAVSGGNLYNAALVRALGAETIGIDELRAEPGLFFVDTLDLRALASFARAAGQRLILIVHHLPSLEPGIAPDDPSLLAEQRALAGFDGYLATSPFTADALAARGIARARVLTVEPGVSFTTAPRSFVPPLRALVVANLIPRKNVRPLLEAIGAAAFDLEIVGRRDLDPEYARACEALAGARVRVRGAVAHEAMGGVYRDANLFVSAAAMETYGMALAEARAHGLPIVALDRGYVRHHVGENGVLVDSIAELAATLARLAADEREHARLFARAQALRTARSWDEAAADFRRALAEWSQR